MNCNNNTNPPFSGRIKEKGGVTNAGTVGLAGIFGGGSPTKQSSSHIERHIGNHFVCDIASITPVVRCA